MPVTGTGHYGPHQRSTGFSLLEVLVALLVLSIGVLGVAWLQVTGLRYNQGAYQSSQATAVIEDLVDRMRTNPQAVADGRYDNVSVDLASPGSLPGDPGCMGSSGGCSPTQLAQHDIRDWGLSSLSRLGGGATASIDGDGSQFTIAVTWEDLAERDDDGDLVPRSMTTQVQLR